MTRTTTFAISLFVLLLAVPQGTALHCNGDIVTVSAGGETLYIDDRSDEASEVNHWVYVESNGREGLQSGGNNPIMMEECRITCLPDACAHTDPDTFIF